jgi:hypothetical protein
MASASFRDSLTSLGWSRRQDEPVSTAPETGILASIRNLNPFQDRSYVRLPTSEGPGAPLPAPSRREEEEGWFVCESTNTALFTVSALFVFFCILSTWSSLKDATPLQRDMCVKSLGHA